MAINVTTIVHDELVRERLLLMAPKILATNRLLVKAMLEEVKAQVATQTPEGPAHFGYHGRDTLRIEVSSKGGMTTGKLWGAVQLYWREYGTGSRYRNQRHKMRSYMAAVGGTGGEAPRMVANKALSYTKRFIRFYYGGMASWWNS